MVQGPGQTGAPDGDAHTLDFNVGLNFGEPELVRGPYAGLRYTTSSVDAFVNSFFVPIPGDTEESVMSTLGYQVSKRTPLSSGVFVSQLRVAWEHEFKDGSSTLFGLPLGTADEAFAVLGNGIGFYGDNGWSVLFDCEATLASDTEGHCFGLKLSKSL